MKRKNTDIEKQKLYPIIPIHIPFSSSFVLPSQSPYISETDSCSDDSEKSVSSSISTTSVSNLVSTVLQSLESGKASNHNLPEQTEEILEQLRNHETRFEIRRIKKTTYSYRAIPQKVRQSISTKCPTSLGTACGIGQYGVMRIYVFEENYDSASKFGFNHKDIILDARTKTISPLTANKNKSITEEEETAGAVGFILPVDSHCVGKVMEQALSDFIQISLLPLSVAVQRYVSSNRAGGLEASPKWRGVVVSSEVEEALREPSGWIYRLLEKKWGVSLVVEDSPFCPEVVEKTGMKLISRISW